MHNLPTVPAPADASKVGDWVRTPYGTHRYYMSGGVMSRQYVDHSGAVGAGRVGTPAEVQALVQRLRERDLIA